MRVLIADRFPLVRQGLASLLKAAHPDWTITGGASLDEVRRACAAGQVDLVSADLTIPGLSSATELASFRLAHPAVRLMVLTGLEDRSVMMECLNAGAHGYVLKSASPEHLLRAVEIIVEGGAYFPASLVGVAHMQQTAPTLPDNLTGRQRDVLDLLVQGYSTKHIARTLNLGIGTVKVHLNGVYRSLGARNRMEAVLKAGAGLRH
jgi:DNA-binding NarL/FixJ family response regulator